MDLPLSDPTRWSYFSDQVMGGISEGEARVDTSAETPILRLTGDVSTANRGGFVQVRTELDTPLSDDIQGVVLMARGNNQRYFVHLRTRGTALPWQYYQAGFDVAEDWQEIRLPFSAFAASGNLLRKTPRPEAIRSIGIVAYGRNHKADVSVRSIGFY